MKFKLMGSRETMLGGVIAFYGIILFSIGLVFVYFPINSIIGFFLILLVASTAYFTQQSVKIYREAKYCHTEKEVAFNRVEFLNDFLKCASSWVLIVITIFQSIIARGFNRGVMSNIFSYFVFIMMVTIPVICVLQIMCYKFIRMASFSSYMNHVFFLMIAWLFNMIYVVQYYQTSVMSIVTIIKVFIGLAVLIAIYGVVGIVHFLWKKPDSIQKGHFHYWFYVIAGVIGIALGCLSLMNDEITFKAITLLFVLLYLLLSVIDDKIVSL